MDPWGGVSKTVSESLAIAASRLLNADCYNGRVLRAAVTAQRVSVMDLLYIGSIDLLPARFLFQNIFILKMYKRHQILSGIRIYIQQACFRGFLISLSRWKIYPSLV